MKGYNKIKREEEIDNLLRYYSETTSENDKFMIKTDLEMLMQLDCEYIWSSENTNDYIEIKD